MRTVVRERSARSALVVALLALGLRGLAALGPAEPRFYGGMIF